MLIFAITLLLGLSVALPFFFSFKSAVGNSVVSNLDYTTMSELVNFHSWNIDSIISQGKFSVMIFWLVMIFFVGGIVRTFNREDFTVATFFSGAGVNFFRFLLCDVIVIFLLLVTAALLYVASTLILSLFHNVTTETPLFWAYGIAAFIFLCIVALYLMISDYAKFYMEMAGTSRVIKAIGKGIKFVFSNFLKTYFLYALLLLAPIVTLILYKLTFDKIGMNTTFGIIAMFFVQQIFIILRVWYRIWSLSSQFEMYADDYVQVISYDLDIKKIEKEQTETQISKTGAEEDLSKSTVVENIVINTEGDTFRKPEEPADGQETVVETVTTTEVVVETVTDTEPSAEPETESVEPADGHKDSVEPADGQKDSEPQVEEQLSQFYSQDQGDGTECNLADLTPKAEPEQQEKTVVGLVAVEQTDNSEPETVETEPEPVETEQVEETKVVVIETTEINSDGDTFTKIVDDSTDSEKPETVVAENNTDTNVTILGEPISGGGSTDGESAESESDDIDVELLNQFYGGDSDTSASSDNDHEVIDIDDMDESVGSAVPLDVEDDDEEDTPSTVTTTTTTTTTSVTTTTTETSTDPDEPRIIKIYTEQEMRDIARKQLEDAGVAPDMALTEVVPEDMPDGVISGERRSEDEFVKRDLADGCDFADPNGNAKG